MTYHDFSKRALLAVLLLCFSFSLKAQDAIDLSGTSNGVKIPYKLSIDSSYTIEFDMYMLNMNNINGAISSTDAHLPAPFDMYVGTDSLLRVLYETSNASGDYFINTDTLRTNTWYHISFSVDGPNDTVVIVLNNKVYTKQLTDAFTWGTTPPDSLMIGNRTSGDTDCNARFDNVKIWNFAKSKEQIFADRNKCIVGNEAGLVALYDFEGISDAFIQDRASLNGNQTAKIFGASSIAVGFVPTALHIDSVTACDFYTWDDTKTYTKDTIVEIFYAEGANGNACDSISRLVLTINYSAHRYDTIVACDSFTWVNGQTYYESASNEYYLVKGVTADACDSNYYLNLTIVGKLDSVTQSNFELRSNVADATYQWLSCTDDNYLVIDGATAQSFTAISTGSYAVVVSKNGCVDTSACFFVEELLIRKPQALDLTGKGNNVKIPYQLGYDSTYTIEFDMYMNYYDSENAGASATDSNAAAPFDIYIDTFGVLNVFASYISLAPPFALKTTSSEATIRKISVPGMQLETWYHIAVAAGPEPDSFRISVNGQVYTNFTNAFTTEVLQEPTFISLGNRSDEATDANAKYDNFRLWSTFRSESELEQSEACYSGFEEGLEIMYNMEEGTGSVLSDLAPAGGEQDAVIEGNYAWREGFILATGIDNVVACDSLVWHDGITYFSDTTGLTFVLEGASALGCDSLVTLNLSIIHPVTGTDVQTACLEFTWIDDSTYTQSTNEATFVLSGAAANGCDSIVTLNLTINTVNTNTSLDGVTISSEAIGATYQWLDCDDAYSAIADATNASFTATVNGNYAVAVTENNCTDTSECVAITTLSVISNDLNQVFKVYPNPTAGNVAIAFEQSQDYLQVDLRSLDGRLLETQWMKNSQEVSLKVDQPKGMYLIEMTDKSGKKAVMRLVKE